MTGLATLRRRVLKTLLERTGAIGPLHRRVERRLARQPHREIDDGRPMPPADLRVAVSGTPDAVWFSERGQADAAFFRNAAAVHGRDLSGDVLDFGCGCGRIARWLAPETADAGGRFTGSDLNPALARWCAAHLPGRFLRNRLDPPLAVAAGSQDLVYAYSVFTHLTEPRARAWLAELARVLRPGGLALVTFHDEAYAERWGPPAAATGLAGQDYLVLNNAMEGSNYLSAWVRAARFRALAEPAFEVLELRPGGQVEPVQALAVLRVRADAGR